MELFKDFTGLYPVQKTLRFELKPQEETAKFLNVAEDCLRAELYPALKKIIDDYYRYYIEEVLSSSDFVAEFNAAELYAAYIEKRSAKDKKTEKAYSDVVAKVCKKISERLNGHLEKYGLKDYKNLIKPDSKFGVWLKEKFDKKEIEPKDYDRYKQAMDKYKGFVTCLTGFQENRKNIFDKEGSTSIAFRVIENMERYFENCEIYKKIISSHTDAGYIFDGVEEYFLPENYFRYVAQSAIDGYNVVLGRSAEDINAKGVNQKLNEYAQKNGLGRRDIPLMSALYKQILSDRQSFLMDTIKDDEDLLSRINQAYDKFEKNVNGIKDIVASGVNGNPEGVFVSSRSLTDISVRLYSGAENAWSVLGNALNLYTENHKVKKDAYKKVISVADLQAVADEYATETQTDRINIAEYFTAFSTREITAAIKAYQSVKDVTEIDGDRSAPVGETKGGKGYEQIQVIKALLDSFENALKFYKPLYLVHEGKKIVPENADFSIYNEFVSEYEQLAEIIPLYNKARNYLTTVTKIDKTKIRNFLNSSSLLTGWSSEYENNGCYIFQREGLYYLVDVLDKKSIDVDKLETDDGKSWKVEYLSKKLDSKNFPRVFVSSETFKQKANEYPNFGEVQKIYYEGSYTKSDKFSEEEYKHSLKVMIDYYKYALSVHDSYKDISFTFKDSGEYGGITEFFADATKSGYSISKTPANFAYLKELERENKILLFQIYNKDFSPYSHGQPNMHTLYFKALFSDENIENIKNKKPFFRLNGGAQIYTRNKSIEPRVTHRKNEPIDNKNPRNKRPTSTFTYDLIKDRRFSEQKMFLHFPITINAGTEDYKGNNFNVKVNKFLWDNPDVNVIGIDRGERHLLYYTVIDRNGRILEQGTLNKITSEYDGGTVETDYHALLDGREKGRDVARKTWGKIEPIAPLKEGYLSNVVSLLAKLMVKYSAVLVLENLNYGMKNSRIKIEKQVYQKFEHAIIDKLNYLVYKDRLAEDDGGVMRGYQLTKKLKTFDEIGKQTGFMFYIDPAYTSKICPKTGFVNLLRTDYLSVSKSQEFFSKFDFIRYNEEGYFEFGIDYDKFGDYSVLARKKWTVCSFGERYYYNPKRNEYVRCDVTEELKGLFVKYGIDYKSGDLVKTVSEMTEKAFFVSLFKLLRIVLQIRNTNGGTGNENDYVLSPVKDKDGVFFDSRKAAPSEPQNADANGAYHIALKGLWVLSNLGEDGKLTDCTREKWFKFRQG